MLNYCISALFHEHTEPANNDLKKKKTFCFVLYSRYLKLKVQFYLYAASLSYVRILYHN